jgi:hypothetical protein
MEAQQPLGELERLLQKTYVPPLSLANIYWGLGELDKYFDFHLLSAKYRAFYLPLVLTSLLLMLAQPIGSAGMSRMPQALASLAAWQVVGGLLFLLSAALLSGAATAWFSAPVERMARAGVQLADGVHPFALYEGRARLQPVGSSSNRLLGNLQRPLQINEVKRNLQKSHQNRPPAYCFAYNKIVCRKYHPRGVQWAQKAGKPP